MKSSILSPTVKFSDTFALFRELYNYFVYYDNFSIHLYNDVHNVTIFTCNSLDLVNKLASLDYSKYYHVFIFGSPEKRPNDYDMLFKIFHNYVTDDLCIKTY